MNNIFILSIFITGLCGLAAQVLLLRELLVSFFGNELTLGIILANWLLSEAAGVFIIGRLVERIKNKINLFITLQIIFSALLFVCVYLARTFKGLLGVGFDEAIGLPVIFYSSLSIILPVAFCHGGLFSAGCKISQDADPARSIGRVYAWEVSGALFGSIILTFFLIPFLNSFQIVSLIAAVNLIVSFFVSRKSHLALPKYLIAGILFFAIFMIKGGGISALQDSSIARQWGNARVLDYRNSVYGSIAVTKQEEQYTFFYNGLPVIVTPFPDRQFVEDFGNFPLLFHPQPEEALFIGGGAGGLISQVLKHPLKRLDYTELDPLVIEMLKKYPCALTEAELNDPRVNIKNVDARFFLKNSENKYDLILIGLSKPADLSSNRHFSEEFFSLAKKKLKEGGILAFWLPGSFTYLSAELKDLNACILGALKNRYNYLRVIPGDCNIVLASDSEDILKAGPPEILQRLRQRNIKDTLLLPAYVEYRLDPEKTKWFFQSLQGAAKKINSDLRPFALFETLSIWNKQFSKKITRVYEAVRELDLLKIFLAVSVLTLALLLILRKGAPAEITVACCVFSTGFFGMLSSLILIFAFQVVCGYLYRSIGLLIGLFMAGTAAGSAFMSARLGRINRGFNLFAALEILLIGFCVALGLIITGLPTQRGNYSLLIFLALFFICGLFLGLEFPLAAKIYLKRKSRIGEVSGILYGADLIGGWLAGIAGGIIFLPILGLFNTCLVMGIFKLSSLVLLLSAKNRLNLLNFGS